MNPIAAVLTSMGHRVTGSDAQASAALARLQRLGVRTYVGHEARHVGDADAVAVSTAIGQDNVELVEARRRGVPVLSRADVLGAICRTRRALAVSGTHGKTTTTAMLAWVLGKAGLDPGFIVGGELPGAGGGANWGNGPWFVVEADESDGTFLRLGAEGVVVTSIEADHLDHFGTFAALAGAFREFVEQAPGPKVICVDGPAPAALAEAVLGRATDVITYGTSQAAAYRATGVEMARTSVSFELSAMGRDLGRFRVAAPGLYNVRNATAAVAMASAVGAEVEAARSALATFGGVGRRFELRGSRDGVTYVDDYAHNPGKVRAVLAAARQGGWDRVVAVFQPHRYSRTEALWRDFGKAFADADVVVVTGIYGAGETPLPGISGRLVADAVREAQPGRRVEYAETRPELVGVLRGLLRPGDLCLTMNAGDLTTLPAELLGPDSGPKEILR
jgi:UDP-N-acetylmuramate--alanine ligase